MESISSDSSGGTAGIPEWSLCNSFSIRDLTPRIGSEIRVDQSSLLNASVARQLRDTLIERGVLVFRGLHLSDEQQLALADMLGTVRNAPGEGRIYKVTLDKNVNAGADYLKSSLLWHMDGTHEQTPLFATLLSARCLPPVGGQTEFANTFAAYEELPDACKARLAGLRAVHSLETSNRKADVEATEENLAYWRARPPMTHSIVWERKSGRKSLVIGCHASHIEGMDPEEGAKLLDRLVDWSTQPQFVYRHEWTPGDLLIWNNTGVLHRARPYPLDSGRLMHRTTLAGEEAFG